MLPLCAAVALPGRRHAAPSWATSATRTDSVIAWPLDGDPAIRGQPSAGSGPPARWRHQLRHLGKLAGPWPSLHHRVGPFILSYFAYEDTRLDTIGEHLLRQQMPDGGWNCRRPAGATHSSVHTTIGALDGLRHYELQGRRGVRQCARPGAAAANFSSYWHFRSRRQLT